MSDHTRLAFIGAKGGVATTTTTLLAAAAARTKHSTPLVVDLTGDVAVLHGLSDADVGASDLAQQGTTAQRIRSAVVPLAAGIDLLPRGDVDMLGVDPDQVTDFWTALGEYDAPIVIDAGTGTAALSRLRAAHLRTALVVDSCFAAIRRAHDLTDACDDLVIVHDARRPFRPQHMEAELGRTASATLTRTEAVALHAAHGVLLDHASGPARPLRRLVDSDIPAQRSTPGLF